MLHIIKKQWVVGLFFILVFNACDDYLDLVPDNIATIEHAFSMRSEAEKYLYTCYSYMPRDGNIALDPAIMGGDEMWSVIDPGQPQYSDEMFRIARGFQNANTPLANNYWIDLYQALRDCNIFLENVGKVPDLPVWERDKWTAEVTFLKAYYHFYLVRMYGPIPLVKENLPITASEEEVKVSRVPVDDCFEYIVELIDEALPGLDSIIANPTREMGRITKPIAAAWKAKVLVTAASPLFNGNTDQSTLKNHDGTLLFNTNDDPEKWERAMTACREAIDICHRVGMGLYEYKPEYQQYKLTDTTMVELSIRNVFCEKWNSEIIWANTQTGSSAMQTLQRLSTANLDPQYFSNSTLRSQLQPPLKIAEMFYTDNGVPIAEDKSRQGVNMYALRTAVEAEQLYVKNGYTTIELHFNREPRFYASLGFDGGIWYGQGKYDNKPDDLFYIACRRSGNQGKKGQQFGPFTGYYWKKCVHYQNVQSSVNGYNMQYYPWPIMRLADLYLLYAEAINEAEGPNGASQAELYQYIDAVRARAGLKGIVESWDTYANNSKYESQAGMRQIIQQERLIELALEGQRFWDLRRWKTATDQFSRAIEGWKVNESAPGKYYSVAPLYQQSFSTKDYFWPIMDSYIENNRNLVQNIGW
ncbi:MAG: RagB/SusD family nutrient uptake outer membrane protein [Bacteroidales bacterium]|nr:RagB/SusD family nutrient uptake outer membrane protein [Bacteroidales bacterium]